MNINHLKYFREVCRQENMTRAAEVCHVSQPSLTAAIGTLEKELGCRLFDKKNNRLSLTPEGSRFLELTVEFLKQYESFSARASELSESRRPAIRIGMPAILGTFFLKKLLPAFQEAHPEIMLDIFEVQTIDGVKMLNRAELDLLVGIRDRTSYSNCDSVRIMTTELCLAVNRKNPISKESRIRADMLAHLPLVSVNKGSYHYEIMMNAFRDVPLDIRMYSNQLTTIEYMIRENMASAVIYKDVFRNDGDIVCVPFANPLTAQVHIFWQKSAYRTEEMKKVISYIQGMEL